MNILHKGAGAEVDGALSQDSCHFSLLSGLLHITAIAVQYYSSFMCVTIIYFCTLLLFIYVHYYHLSMYITIIWLCTLLSFIHVHDYHSYMK